MDQGQATKKLEKQVKDLKAKVMVAENLVLKKGQEYEQIKAKLEKSLQDEEKWAIRDKFTFEKYFGKAPS